MGGVHLVSDSREYDANLVALFDATVVCKPVPQWFVVGGNMVNLHILRSGLRLPLRYTHDADLAVTVRDIKEGGLVGRLRELGYRNPTYHNRFEKSVGTGLVASIDLVVASGSTKHKPNIKAEVINVDGMPVIDEAMERGEVTVDLVADRSDGRRIEFSINIPDLLSAIAMKSFAVAERSNPKDVADLYHLLLVAEATGAAAVPWPRGKAFSAAKAQLGAQFDQPGTALPLTGVEPPGWPHLRELTRALLAS